MHDERVDAAVLRSLPAEYDSRVKAMEVDEKPTEDYSDIGGLDKQIQELREAVVLPMTHADKFKTLGIRAPKGVLLYGPPGTGKTLIARACAAQTNATYLKLAGPLLVQAGSSTRLLVYSFIFFLPARLVRFTSELCSRAIYTVKHRGP